MKLAISQSRYRKKISVYSTRLASIAYPVMQMQTDESDDYTFFGFTCTKCNYRCARRNDLHKHFSTQKHKRTTQPSVMGLVNAPPPLLVVPSPRYRKPSSTTSTVIKVINPSSNGMMTTAAFDDNSAAMFGCVCGKTYRHLSSLCKHRRKCDQFLGPSEPPIQVQESPVQVQEPVQDMSLNNMVAALLGEQTKRNDELKEMLDQQGKQLAEMMASSKTDNNPNITNNITTINNNTNKFNLNVFLNSDCKDAMNVMDFVKMIKVTPDDLERLADVGYVEGVTRMMMDGLRKLDVCQRPIHCTDVKRESFYIKDNDIWEKDNASGDKMHRVVKHVAHQNVVALPAWQKENPTHTDYHTRAHERYLGIVNAAFGGSTQQETDHYRNKIIRRAAPDLVAPKNSTRIKS